MTYLTNIGLEVHVQLRTRSKMFCGCAVEFGAPANSLTCPTCLGLPGALPVINHEALRLTTLTGVMLGCEIAPLCTFERKNYFYPDMPKNYQISQYAVPLCRNGRVTLTALAYPKDVRDKVLQPDKTVPLVRIHLEEDVAKSFHLETSTAIDFNRAGTPLMEIVTQPQIRSPEEAFAFLTALKLILVYGQISDAEMEKGQLRCDCNISVRPDGQSELGAKIEIKNMNSISGVRRALAYEVKRQISVLAHGEALLQETRRWDDDAGVTFPMREKEMAHDYRYFPDPDLLPVRTESLLAEIRGRVPELPDAKRARFIAQYGVTAYDAGVLANDLELADYFERAARAAGKPKLLANWILNDLQSALTNIGLTIGECPVAPASLNELVNLIEEGRISGRQAKEVFAEMLASGKSPAAVVEEKGLAQLSDRDTLEKFCDQVIALYPKSVADFRAGNAAALNFLKGQVMKLSRGQANPTVVGEILVSKFSQD